MAECSGLRRIDGPYALHSFEARYRQMMLDLPDSSGELVVGTVLGDDKEKLGDVATVSETFEHALLALGYLERASGDAQPRETPRPWGSLAPIPRIDLPPRKAEVRWIGLGLVAVAIAAVGLLAFGWSRRRAA